ncbi:hypothetical protein FRB93_005294 [Tulasnella sp. JGI-2019a]|nr:hypothetical protein FRB93_005294 [Tulasnella sp. JGI-2019a]
MLSLILTSLVLATTLSGINAAKRGLAWPSDNNFQPSVFNTNGQVNWIYNWGTTPASTFNQIGNYYVMQWGSGGITGLAAAVKATGTQAVLGFNEPDNAGQANLTPAAAAALWKQYIQPLKTTYPNLKLISPAVTNGGAPSGIAWLDSFFASCVGCKFDGVAIHWYGGGTGDLEPFVTSAYKYNLPVYLTGTVWPLLVSLHCQGAGAICIQLIDINVVSRAATEAQYEAFLTPALAWLDGQSQVAKYAFFGAFYDGNPDDLLTSTGQLTALGKIYA